MKGQTCLIALTLTLTLIVMWADGKQAAQNTSHVAFPSFPFRVSYSPRHLVQNQTLNVSMRCEFIPDAQHTFLFVDFLIISKAHFQGGWTDLAKVDYLTNKTYTFRTGFTAHGATDPVDQAFLEIKWPRAAQEIFGIYSCIVHGNDEHFNVLEETSELLIEPHDCNKNV